jgi:fatty-acyl-CoA synthase
MTELSPVSHMNPDDADLIDLGSIGPALPNTECAVVDLSSGEFLGPHRDGELWVRGPQVMQGYLNNPEATAATLDRDGWLHTGDIARRDSDGCYSILGRSKEMFISGGENVYPAEIESVLLAHPLVNEAAVVGVPHETWGEVGRAFLVVGHGFDEAELKTFLTARLARYKLPRVYTVLEAMPLTAIGKLDKKLLAAKGTPP